MIKITIRHLTAVRELARTQSFTQAAQRLHTTQSNLSLAIQEAESILGVRLFDRTTKRCRLTEVGAEFLGTVDRVLEDLQTGIDNVDASVRLQRGRLSLGAASLLTSTLLPEPIARFQGMHPNIELRIEDSATSEHIGLLRSGDIELAVGTYSCGNADLAMYPLLEVPLVLFAHKSLKLGRQMRWEALRDARLVSIVRNSSVGQLVDATWWELFARAPKPTVEVHHWSTVLALTESLKSMCIAPAHAGQGNRYRDLRSIELIEPSVTRTISVAHLRDHQLSPVAQAFLEQLVGDSQGRS